MASAGASGDCDAKGPDLAARDVARRCLGRNPYPLAPEPEVEGGHAAYEAAPLLMQPPARLELLQPAAPKKSQGPGGRQPLPPLFEGEVAVVAQPERTAWLVVQLHAKRLGRAVRALHLTGFFHDVASCVRRFEQGKSGIAPKKPSAKLPRVRS